MVRKTTVEKCAVKISSSTPKIKLDKISLTQVDELLELRRRSNTEMAEIHDNDEEDNIYESDVANNSYTIDANSLSEDESSNRNPSFTPTPRTTRRRTTINVLKQIKKSETHKKCVLFKRSTAKSTSTVAPPRKTTCDFCTFKSSRFGDVWKHSVIEHSFQMYSKHLPPNTTENELKQAIKATLDHHLYDPLNRNKTKDVKCLSCNKIIPASSQMLLHILSCHLNQIMVKLRSQLSFMEEHASPAEVEDLIDIKQEHEDSDNLFEDMATAVEDENSEYEPEPDEIEAEMNIHKKEQGPIPTVVATFQQQSETDISSKSLISRSVIVHHKNESQTSTRVSCSFCSRHFRKESEKSRHEVSIHQMLFLADKLPLGTTQAMVTKACQFLERNQVKYSSQQKGKKFSYGCPYCSRILPTQSFLKIHLLQIHMDKVALALVNPGDVRLSRTQETHTKKVQNQPHKSRVLPCPSCKYKAKSKIELITHKKTHQQALLKCALCCYSFKREADHINHFIRVHTFAYLEKQLPPGTTKEVLDSVIENWIGSEGKDDGNERLFCVICQKTVRNVKPYDPSSKTSEASDIKRNRRHVRFHIINLHVDTLLDKMKSL